MNFNKNILKVDSEKEINRICEFLKEQVQAFKKQGILIGLSGGIDSALCAALCVRALGQEKVLGLILPEKESSPASKTYALKCAQSLGIKTETIDISPVLEALGTYRKRDAVIQEIIPDYDSNYRIKISLPPDLLTRDALNFFTLTVDNKQGNIRKVRLKKKTLYGITAATNTKQRMRMVHLYYYAEKMNLLVCGTTNRSETQQGFFVKFGDGGVDIEPIAHLYKTQVYQLSNFLGIIEEIIKRPPSPDTFSFEVDDEEFYFRMPYEKLDLLLYAWENHVPVAVTAYAMNLSEEQVKRAFRDITAKYTATQHLRMLPPDLYDKSGDKA